MEECDLMDPLLNVPIIHQGFHGNSHFESFVEVLQLRAQKNPDHLLYTFLKEGEEEEASLSYAALDSAAQKIAAHLQERLKPGSRVVLLFPSGLAFIQAFFGCLYAGVIAIPLPLPSSKLESFKALEKVVQHAGVLGILSTIPVLDKMQDSFKQFKPTQLFSVFDLNLILEEEKTAWKPIAFQKNDLAFLQYTSGSTADPKGVMVSHGNLLHNQTLIQASFNTSSQTVFVTWLPHYHDMGLIGTLLHPLYMGCTSILMSPMAFLQKPMRWLAAISKYKGTVSGGPNFAYALCVSRVQKKHVDHLDLSSWLVAFNGAEKVRANTIEDFSRKFSVCGFERSHFFSSYGLAESTLFASGSGFKVGPHYFLADQQALEQNQAIPFSSKSQAQPAILVSVGQGWLDQTLMIVNPDSLQPCLSGEIGEVWIQGPSVAKGYWKEVQKSQASFHAFTQEGAGPFLRTGDLGFIHGGELYITGRIKDMIILRGRNIYPEEIEIQAQNLSSALRVGGGAAFSIECDEGESIVLIQEVERQAIHLVQEMGLVEKIKSRLLEQFELSLSQVILIGPHQLPKTSSGKVKRQVVRAQFLAGKFRDLSTASYRLRRMT